MDVVSLCPLLATGVVWQPRAGAYAQTVIVKGTFRLQPGESVLAEAQEAPTEVDLAPFKPKADVVLVGHAYAPKNQPARSWMVRLVVGELDKSIEVWCDRAVRWQDGTLLEGPRVTKVPLVWERAAGGPETNNPVGMRFHAAPDRYGMVPIPNLQPPGYLVSSRADTFSPVCFGPIAPTWPRPSARLGRLAPGWEGRPLPETFDYGYFQVAPLDQQVSEIRTSERLVLENLHPEHGRLVTNLPLLRPRAILDRATGEREEVQLLADTLWIDSDRGTCSLVWRGRVGLRHAGEAGRIAVWLQDMPFREAHRRAADADADADVDGGEAAATMTIVASCAKTAEPALPFVPGLSRLSEPERRSLGEELSRFGELGDGSETLYAPRATPVGNALPFEGADEVSADEGDTAKTLPPMGVPRMEAAPFVVQAKPWSTEMPVEPEQRKAPLPAPPAMIGPLATAEMVARSEAVPVEGKPDEEPLTAPRPEAKAEQAKKPGPEAYPLERCAALTASIARRKAEKGKMLEAEGLTEGEWVAIERYWAEAIKEETKRGKRGMLDRFDQAYVARLEEERGVITVEEYARLSVAGERGTVDEVIKEMGLPRGAVMRVERVWMRRIASEIEIQEIMRHTVDRARM